ncbi:MAG TPA: helix-turn-helix domain-containing protein [Solirubrobacteraceae bacterium]|nr:helix-turn-helix domain-containing protein [Solirubrobacteraceae bacterium]
MTDSAITIELTSRQVDRIIRGASSRDFASDLMRGLADSQAPTPDFEALSESPRLSRSLLLGLLVLACFPADGNTVAVTQVAARLGMSASTTHRYMTTLLAVGLLEQDPRTRRYRIPVEN